MEKYTRADLLLIFGMALRAKANEMPSRHQLPGKHTRGKMSHPRIEWKDPLDGKIEHSRCEGPHPAGTKLVRSFIRRSNRESVANRRTYARLTGHQYVGTSS